MSNIETLMQEAAVAGPPKKPCRCVWAQFIPVVTILREQRGYSLAEAVNWLVERDEITPAKRRAAYVALCQYSYRKSKKAKKANSKEAA